MKSEFVTIIESRQPTTPRSRSGPYIEIGRFTSEDLRETK